MSSHAATASIFHGDLSHKIKQHPRIPVGFNTRTTSLVIILTLLITMQALHTLSLNGGRQVRDQIALSKCMKHLDRLLNKPPFPGVEMAAAQLLMDWAFLYG